MACAYQGMPACTSTHLTHLAASSSFSVSSHASVPLPNRSLTPTRRCAALGASFRHLSRVLCLRTRLPCASPPLPQQRTVPPSNSTAAAPPHFPARRLARSMAKNAYDTLFSKRNMRWLFNDYMGALGPRATLYMTPPADESLSVRAKIGLVTSESCVGHGAGRLPQS